MVTVSYRVRKSINPFSYVFVCLLLTSTVLLCCNAINTIISTIISYTWYLFQTPADPDVTDA